MEPQRVTMIRHTLSGIPQHALPPGYSIRWYRPGDRETWLRIHALAEKEVPTSAAIYEAQFAADEPERARRQAFLLDPLGGEIGTASAWFNADHHGMPFGRVHWVAIAPAHQGKGLAKPLLAAICHRLIEIGHDRAYLTTWSNKLPAIHLYLAFGFEPEIRAEEERQAWKSILDRISGLKRA
ncbi:MAG: GNAT family N-acetyltransferase [Verrucomicrobia bacterium]|nr:GNAT family N-acetyltransferase [Verrucomicrobiota bacterium]